MACAELCGALLRLSESVVSGGFGFAGDTDDDKHFAHLSASREWN